MLDSTHRFHGLNALNYVYKQGQVVRGSALTLKYVLNSRRKTYRVAVVVSKKVSKSAVVRNRIRRRVYEVVRAHTEQLGQPYDLVFMVYSEDVAIMENAKLESAVRTCLHKAGVIT